MHPGTYFTSGLGTTQCSRSVGIGEWQSASAPATPSATTTAASPNRWHMRRSLEFHADLHQWNDSQPEWNQLCGQLLDAKSDSLVQQRRRRKRTTLDGDRKLHYRHSSSASATSPTAATSRIADLRSLYRHEPHRG